VESASWVVVTTSAPGQCAAAAATTWLSHKSPTNDTSRHVHREFPPTPLQVSDKGQSRFFRWCDHCDGHGVNSRLKSLRVLFPAVTLSENDFGQAVHTHVPVSPSSIIWYRSRVLMPCSWEGNRRSGVGLAIRHRLQRFIHLRAYGIRNHHVDIHDIQAI